MAPKATEYCDEHTVCHKHTHWKWNCKQMEHFFSSYAKMFASYSFKACKLTS